MFSAFRNEIIESEKARTDLLRWKLILVAVLGAVGLGINIRAQSGQPASPTISPQLVLCLIPIACVYVDLLCKHLKIRILVISKFFQDYSYDAGETSDSEIKQFRQYEKFCEKIRDSKVFVFEDLAQEWSTIILSILTIIAPFLIKKDYLILIIFGILGIILTMFTNFFYEKKIEKLKEEAENFKEKEEKLRTEAEKLSGSKVSEN